MKVIERLGYFFKREPKTALTLLQIEPTISVPGLSELPVPIIVHGGTDKDGFEYTSVTMSCPLGCGVSIRGKSLTNGDTAFDDASKGMSLHLRHDHQQDITEYNVVNFYMPQIYLLKVHLHL